MDLGWCPWPVLPKRRWPALRYQEKRAITKAEHEKILASETEWEKAARGWAEGRRFPWTDTDDITHSRANYEVWRLFGSPTNFFAYDKSPTSGWHPAFVDGSDTATSPVGYFAANGFGLDDMAGNVAEWCSDWYLNTYYSSSPATDPRGPASGTSRIQRGGSWDHWASGLRCAYRGLSEPVTAGNTCGFRCVRGR